MRNELLEAERVESIVAGFFHVYNYYGFGLSESVYAGALALELADRGHAVVREVSVEVMYKGRHAAWQRLDIVVDERVIVEVKAAEKLHPAAWPQLLAYVRASTMQVGLLLHFGPSPKFQKLVDSVKRVRN